MSMWIFFGTHNTTEKCGWVWEQYPSSSIVAGRSSCLPSGGLHASGSCEGGPLSAPSSIIHREILTPPGGFVLVYCHLYFLSSSLTAGETVVYRQQETHINTLELHHSTISNCLYFSEARLNYPTQNYFTRGCCGCEREQIQLWQIGW